MKQHFRCFRWLCVWLFVGLLPNMSWGGVDFSVYGEIPLNQSLDIPLDQGTGPGHGIIYFQYTNTKHFGKGNHFRAGLNTDAFWLAWDIGAAAQRPLVLSPYIKGQFGFGEMTPDYIAGGLHIEELSFFSFYTEVGVDWRYRLFRSLFVGGNLGFRYWFFAHRGSSETSGFILPQDSPAIQTTLSVGWEGMNIHLAKGRLYEGIRIRIGLHLRERFIRQPWGGGQTTFKDLRNHSQPRAPTFQGTALLEGAKRIHERLTISFHMMAGGGWFADDLHRFKVGGDNEYVPMISGTNFAEFVVDSYFLSHFKLVWLPLWWLRLTPQFDLAWIPDLQRKGQMENARFVMGMGLSFDFFLQDYARIHLKVGYAPNAPRPKQDGGFKVYLGYTGSWW